tara:strand:+ start:6708 stop:6845 length:138 start_codon:yes stop_codon:yes gene_type:complete
MTQVKIEVATPPMGFERRQQFRLLGVNSCAVKVFGALFDVSAHNG